MSKPTTHHTSASGEIPLTAFIVPERLRTDDEAVRQYIELELVPSIAENGLIQPIVLNKITLSSGLNLFNETITSEYELIAGWSRSQAFLLLQHTSIPYCFRENLDRASLHMLEVEENIRRRAMRWTDRVLAVEKVHSLRTEKAHKVFEKWGQRATGELLRVNVATISQSLLIAAALKANDQEIFACTSFDEAKKLCLKRKQQESEAELAKRQPFFTVAEVKKAAPTLDNPKGLILNPIAPPPPAQAKEVRLLASQDIKLSEMLFNRDCVTPSSDPSRPWTGWMTEQRAESIDLIFTDIPYGIDMANLDLVTLADVETEHDVDENVSLMLPFLSESYRLLKPKSYLIFFMDLKHWEKLIAWGNQVGFDVMPYPIIWHKTSSVKNRAASKWWPKKIEYLMVMAKGSATLREAQTDLVIAASGEAERKKYGHPFAKPFEVIQKVLAPIVTPGMLVLDPFAGSGSTILPLLSMGCRILACEKQEAHFNRLLLNAQDTFKRICGIKTPNFC